VNGTLYDTRADIWSLGICLIELCDGVVPNARLNKRKVLNSISEGPSPTLKESSNWSQELSNFLECCLQKDILQRSTSTELLHHLWVSLSISQLQNNFENNLLRQLCHEAIQKKEELYQEYLKQQQEAEERLQQEKKDMEEYFRQKVEQEEMERKRLEEIDLLRRKQLEESQARERELERERIELLKKYAEEAEMLLKDLEREQNNQTAAMLEDYHSFLSERQEMTNRLTKVGWMKKRAHYLKWWNLRWVHLSRGKLRYFLSNDSSDLLNERGLFLLLENTKMITESNASYHLSRNSFILLNPPLTPSTPLPRLSHYDEEMNDENNTSEAYDLTDLSSQEIFHFKCSSENEVKEWIEVIRSNILYKTSPIHSSCDPSARYLPQIMRDLSMQGWVEKRGDYGFWNRRYFILELDKLLSFTDLPPSTPSTRRPHRIYQLTSTCHLQFLDQIPTDGRVGSETEFRLHLYERYHQDESKNWDVIIRSETLNELFAWEYKIRTQISLLEK
jgi:serine/threonine protein kinase